MPWVLPSSESKGRERKVSGGAYVFYAPVAYFGKGLRQNRKKSCRLLRGREKATGETVDTKGEVQGGIPL